MLCGDVGFSLLLVQMYYSCCGRCREVSLHKPYFIVHALNEWTLLAKRRYKNRNSAQTLPLYHNMLLDLPNEILDDIASQGDTSIQFNLSVASQLLYEVCTRRLYSVIYLDDFNLVPFLCTMFTDSLRTSFIDRCLLTRKLYLAVRDPVYIARTNPYLFAVLRQMGNLQTLSIVANAFSGKIMYGFMVRSACLLPPSPDLISSGEETNSETRVGFLANLMHLYVGSETSLINIAIGRSLQSLTLSKVKHLRPVAVVEIIRRICSQGVVQPSLNGLYPSLRRLCFSMVVEMPRDLLLVMESALEAFPNLDDLDITLYSESEHVSTTHSSMKHITNVLRSLGNIGTIYSCAPGLAPSYVLK